MRPETPAFPMISNAVPNMTRYKDTVSAADNIDHTARSNTKTFNGASAIDRVVGIYDGLAGNIVTEA